MKPGTGADELQQALDAAILVDDGSPSRRRARLDLVLVQTATVVPITSTHHGSPTEVVLGVEDGLKGASCANLANIQTVGKRGLTHYVGTARPEKMAEVCVALAIAVGCD